MSKHKFGTKKLVGLGLALAMGLTTVPVGHLAATRWDEGVDTSQTVSVLYAPKTPAEQWQYSKDNTHKLRNVLYYGDFCKWGGQGNNEATNLPTDLITHLNYSFLYPDAQGNIHVAAGWNADGTPKEEIGSEAFKSPNGILTGWWPDPTYNGRWGQVPAFQHIRAKNPNVRIGTSFGGWSLGGNFSKVVHNPTARANFVSSALAWTRYNGFDFVDIDWEYPGFQREPDLVDNKNDLGTPDAKTDDGDRYVDLISEMRTAFDDAGKEDGKYYEISAALPAGKSKIDLMDNGPSKNIEKLYKLFDFVNIMTYDMRGAWEDVSGHHAGLYSNPAEKNRKYKVRVPDSSPEGFHLEEREDRRNEELTTSDAVDYYLARGGLPEKTVIGAAYYTRGWEQVANDGGATMMDGTPLPGLYGTATQVRRDSGTNDKTRNKGTLDSPRYDETNGDLTYGALNQTPAKYGDSGRLTGTWGFGTFKPNSVKGGTYDPKLPPTHPDNDDILPPGRSLDTKYPKLKEYYDDYSEAPYFYDGANGGNGAFFTFDNERSIAAKGRFIHGERKNANGAVRQTNVRLGGMISWMASNDRPKAGKWDDVGAVRSVLIEASKKAVFDGKEGRPSSIPRLEAKSILGKDLKLTAAKSGNGFNLTLQNQQNAGGSGSPILNIAENVFNHVPFVKVHIKGDYNVSATGAERKYEDGYTTINWDSGATKDAGKETLTPGASKSFSITCKPGCTNPGHGTASEKIPHAFVTKRLEAAGPYLAKKDVIEEDPNAGEEPVIEGAGNITLNVGDAFDPKAGVFAKDPGTNDNLPWSTTVDQIKSIYVESNVKLKSGRVEAGGPYTIRYTAKSSFGVRSTVDRIVTVKDDSEPDPIISGVQEKVTIVDGSEDFDPMAGVSAKAGTKDLPVTIEGEIGTYPNGSYKTGTYQLTYKAKNSKGAEATKTSTVTVGDPVPMPNFVGLGDKEVAHMDNGGRFRNKEAMEGVGLQLEGVDVTDQYTITVDVGIVDTEAPGKYVVPYTATYKADNTIVIKANRNVTVLEKVKPTPVITIASTKQLVFDLDTTDTKNYTKAMAMEGVTAMCGTTDVTGSVTVNNPVDLSVEGRYIVKYNVMVDGIPAQEVTCTIVVQKKQGDEDVETKVGWKKGKIYEKGEILFGGGHYYVAARRNQAKKPSENTADWTKTSLELIRSGAETYQTGKTYLNPTVVNLGGTLYQATRPTAKAPVTLKGWRIIQ